MKRTYTILTTLAVLLVCLFLLPTEAEAAEIGSGTCGDNLTWVLDDSGTLTISGTGEMNPYDYYWSENTQPWKDVADSIKHIVIENGVTSIGNWAFTNCTGLTSITMPNSVTRIGDGAFDYCYNLTSITIPDSVTYIGDRAFLGCIVPASVTIPNSVTYIGYMAFYSCYRLTSVTIGNGVNHIGSNAFYAASNLWHVLYTGGEQYWNAIDIEKSGNQEFLRATRHYNCNGNEVTDPVNKVCTICNPVCTHTYDNNCDTSCNSCGQTRITSHAWDGGKVTKEATCKDEGVMTYTCTECKATRTEAIEKKATHTPGPDATATTDQVCTVCGKVLNKATGAAPTEPPTQPPTDAPTEPPTEPTTQPSTEPVTEPATEPSTNAPTEPNAGTPSDPADGNEEQNDPTTVIVIVAVVTLAGGGAAAGIILWKKKH